MLHYAILYYSILHMLCCTLANYTIQNLIILCSAILCYVVLYHTMLYRVVYSRVCEGNQGLALHRSRPSRPQTHPHESCTANYRSHHSGSILAIPK